MRSLRFVIPLLAPLLFLAGCVTPIDAGRVSTMRQVGVVSVLGDRVQIQMNGTPVFGNRNGVEMIPEFHNDAVATEAMLQNLRPRFSEVVALSAEDRAALPPLWKAPEGFMNQLLTGSQPLWKPQSPETAAGVRQLAQTRRLDTLVVAYPITTTSDYAPIPFEGVGIAGVNKFGLRRLDTFANLAVAVYDGPTGKLIRSTPGLGKGVEKLDIRFKETIAEYSPAEREQLRESVQAKIRTRIDTALINLGLVSAGN